MEEVLEVALPLLLSICGAEAPVRRERHLRVDHDKSVLR